MNAPAMVSAKRQREIRSILRQTKLLAARYYKLTGKPLGVTGEIAEYAAAERLKLTLAAARTAAFDATARNAGRLEYFQIKGRAVDPSDRYRGRVPKIGLGGAFDTVLLVLLDKTTFDAIEIWKATRRKVEKRLTDPGSRARNERGQMSISQFKSIAEKVWPASAKVKRKGRATRST